VRGVAAALLLLIATTAVVVWERRDSGPHGFRVVIDDLEEEPTKLVWAAGGKPLSLGVYSISHVVSPDGRTAVFGSQSDDRLRYVDLVARRLSIGPRTTAFAMAESCGTDPHLWSRSDRIIATGWCGDAHRTGASTLVIVDPAGTAAIRTIGSGPLAKAGDAVVLFTSPPPGPFFERTFAREERLGLSRLLRIDADGSISAVTVRIRSGMRDARTLIRWPGFAVRGHRAVVVSEDEGTAEIDLRTLSVRYHDVSFPARPRRLLPPPVQHQGTANPARILARNAHWVDDHRIAVTGYDVWTKNHYNQCGEAGPWILDTQTWKARVVRRTSKLVAKHRPYITRCLG
jgi:hypothetical protein